MDKVTAARKFLKKEQWIKLIRECQSSGMSVTSSGRNNNRISCIQKVRSAVSTTQYTSCSYYSVTSCNTRDCGWNQSTNDPSSASGIAKHMLGDITVAKNMCGYTDMRKSIDGLAAVVQEEFHLDSFSPSLFLFCGKRRDRMKVLLWEGDGFVLLYKRLENGNFKWPRKESEVKPISWQEIR
jgi:transposase